MDMNTEELKNKIKADIKNLVELEVGASTYYNPLDVESGEGMCDNTRIYLELECEYSEEEMDFFKKNVEEFIDYYFECLEDYCGVKYVRKNGDYYLVLNEEVMKRRIFANIDEWTEEDLSLPDVLGYNELYDAIYLYLKHSLKYSQTHLDYFKDTNHKYDYVTHFISEYCDKHNVEYEQKFDLNFYLVEN